MNTKEYSEFLVNKAQNNFEKNSKYFQFESKLFTELRPLVYQITNCLILESYIPALTATNYLLERLLKIALIYNDVKIESVELEKLNSLYDIPNKKYVKLPFEKSIEKCRTSGLIDDSEKEFINIKIRPLIRNSYSHGDPTKISNTLPKKSKAFVASFNEPGQLKEIDFEKHYIPTFQSQLFDDFAKQNSLTYFDFAYKLINNIEKRINYFHKK